MKLTVVLAVVIGTLVLACSTVTPVPADPTHRANTPTTLEPTPNIDETVEARLALEQVVDATVQPKEPTTLSPETPKTSNEPQEI